MFYSVLVVLVVVVVVVMTGCMSMMGYTSVQVNGIPAYYSTTENIEYGKIVTVDYPMVSGSEALLGAPAYTFILSKTLTNSQSYYKLVLQIDSQDWLFLEGYKMKIDGEIFDLKDPDPYRKAKSGGIIQERINPKIDESMIKRISEASSPIYLQYMGSEPIIINGEELQKVKQYAKGLLDINTPNDLGL